MAAQEFLSAPVQDYAKAVYALETRGGAAVSTNDLASRLGVTPASVSGMLRKLTAFVRFGDREHPIGGELARAMRIETEQRER
jgi:NADH/NAD ratio-sensing transcriptional regulator Rex